jgi:hypothetical protein
MISQNTNQWPTAIYVPGAGRHGKSMPIAVNCLALLAEISILGVVGIAPPQFGTGSCPLTTFFGEYPQSQNRSIRLGQVGATTAAELSVVRTHTETFHQGHAALNHSPSVREYPILSGVKQDFQFKFELKFSDFIADFFGETGVCISSLDRWIFIVRDFIWPLPTPPPSIAKNKREAFEQTMKLVRYLKITLLSKKWTHQSLLSHKNLNTG